jgi:hypothetical protein
MSAILAAYISKIIDCNTRSNYQKQKWTSCLAKSEYLKFEEGKKADIDQKATFLVLACLT